MNTITIDDNIYRGAELYAKLHNISITKLVEKAILNIVSQKEKPFELKKEEELSPEIRSLIGVVKAPSQIDDLNGRNARMEYLKEKYSL